MGSSDRFVSESRFYAFFMPLAAILKCEEEPNGNGEEPSLGVRTWDEPAHRRRESNSHELDTEAVLVSSRRGSAHSCGPILERDAHSAVE